MTPHINLSSHATPCMPDAATKGGMTSRSGRCHYLKLSPSRLHWWATYLAVQAADLALALVRNPEKLAAKILAATRLISGMRRKDIATRNLTWPYLDGGRGETVVLLHGYGADKDRFGTLVPYLRRNYRVVIPDLPGFGDHCMVDTLVYDVTSQVRRLDAFFQALRLKRFHLLGLSLGGYVAAMYAAQFPHKAMSLALMDTAGLSAPCDSDAWVRYRRSGRNIFLYTTAEEVETLAEYLFHRPVKLPKRILDHWVALGAEQLAWRRKLIDDLIAGGLSLLDTWASRIQAPTLLLWGADDRVCHVSSVNKLLQLIPDSQAYIFQSCGHIPLYEYPRAFRCLYGRFLHQISD